MKAICMPQPWATMLCAGAQDVLSMAWKPEKNPGKILLVATNTQIPLDYHAILPSAWSYRMDNYIATGRIPRVQDLPQESIVGYVEIDGFSHREESVWSLPDCWSWMLKEAHLFQDPIPYKGGKDFVFDIPEMDEANLPATRTFQQPAIEGGTLTMPLCQEKFDSILNGDKEFDINLYEENRDLFTSHEGKIWGARKVDSVTIVSPQGGRASYAVREQQLIMEKDSDGTAVKIEKLGGWEYLYYVLYTLGDKL